MESVSEFAKSFVWNARGILLPVTLAIPAALVGISLIRAIYQNHSLIPKKMKEAKNFLVSSFSRREGESAPEFRKRVMKNLFIGSSCTTLFSAVAFGCVFCPFLLLPSYLAIPAAISGICLLGDLLVNGKSYSNSLKEKAGSAKEWAKDAFTSREGELPQEAKWRIAKNIALTALGVTVAAGTVAATAFGIYSLVHYALAQSVSAWNAYKLLPFQTPVVVFLEYTVVGVLHGALAIKNWIQRNKAAVAFHFSQFVLSFAFPIFYLLNATPTAPMRLHHSIIGLTLSLLPFNTTKAIGATIALDSALYFFSSWRGHGTEQYDFMNFFLENKEAYIPAIGALCGAEYAIDRLLPKEGQEKSSEKRPQEKGKIATVPKNRLGLKRSYSTRARSARSHPP